MKRKYLITLILVVALMGSLPAVYASAHATQWTIPTFSIVSVKTDSKVTIQTFNFPADKTFTVRMGPFGTAAIGGTVVGSTDSGDGGSFTTTYKIPSNLKGLARIAIRMDADSGGWFAYNWFFNKTGGSTGGATATPVATSFVIPTFSIQSVDRDSSVTIKTSNFPADKTFTVRMGVFGTAAIGGTVVGTTDSGDGGSFTATYDIPSNLKGLSRIAIRMDADSGGWFAYNWFWNNTTGTVSPTVTPGATFTGIPTFSIQSVVRNSKVTIKTNNFPADETFTVRMGVFGTAAIGGTVVGTTDSGKGGSFTATYDIPSNLQGLSRIAIRMDSTDGFFAFNWFWNNTAN